MPSILLFAPPYTPACQLNQQTAHLAQLCESESESMSEKKEEALLGASRLMDAIYENRRQSIMSSSMQCL